MSHHNIQKLSDLDFVINDTITLVGHNNAIEKEIYHNMWAIDFDNDFIKTITSQDLCVFLTQLLEQRSAQIAKNYPHLKATFYLWHDELAEQLRFNILSGANITLPFRCKTNFISTPVPIIQAFLKDAQAENHPLDFENFTFLNPGDPGWDEFDDDDEEEDISQQTITVYVITLPQKNISSIINNTIS